MDGLPVTIRLLDPPLHEFLPAMDDLDELAEQMALEVDELSAAGRRRCTRSTRCSGLRGVRLGMTFPDVTRMQVRAILTAATLAAREGVDGAARDHGAAGFGAVRAATAARA